MDSQYQDSFQQQTLSSPTPSSPSQFFSPTQEPNQNSIKCHCGLDAILKMATTQRNSGRYFYSCPKYDPENDTIACNFFRWKDVTNKTQIDASSASRQRQRETIVIGTGSPASTSRLSTQIEITDYDKTTSNNNSNVENNITASQLEKTLTNIDDINSSNEDNSNINNNKRSQANAYIVKVASITAKNTSDAAVSSENTRELMILSDSDNESTTAKISSNNFIDSVIKYICEQNKTLSHEKLLKNEARLHVKKLQYEIEQLKQENQELRLQMQSIKNLIPERKRKNKPENEDENENEEEQVLRTGTYKERKIE
ncbi:2938_t:CDS:1 [Ambispora leptoticha]|uniref:2938_t:CDS:1 n=1 Tax=Ambispora leptoticha TaxID=144679 RepID=A0A9N9B129_9GLOM|nr:2938_t:CDS:1 [Ambispora leptoticha]